MFIVAEDQIGIGDVVDLGLASGVVEYVSVRITQVRDVNGTLWYVRNGEVTRIGNMSQGWARSIIDLGVPADSDLEQVEHIMLETAQGLAKDPKWRTRIIEKPELWGLESIDGDALVVRIVIKAPRQREGRRRPGAAASTARRTAREGDRRSAHGRRRADGPRRGASRARSESAQDPAECRDRRPDHPRPRDLAPQKPNDDGSTQK